MTDLLARRTRPRVPVELVGLAALALASGLAVRAGWLDGLVLDSGTTMVLVVVAAFACLVVVLMRRPRRWWFRTLPVVVVSTTALVAGVAWYLGASHTITDPYPPTFLVWVGLALASPALVGTGRRRDRAPIQPGRLGEAPDRAMAVRARRLASVLAVPLAVAAAFILINSHYGYWPTLGDLLGHPIVGQVSSSTIAGELRTTVPPSSPRLSWVDRDERGRQLARADRARAQRPVAPVLVRSSLDTVAPSTPGALVHQAAVPMPRVGQFAAVEIPATTSHFVHRWDYVYLPPAYFSVLRPDLGVVIMLSGTPSTPSIWATGGGAVATANRYAAAHGGVAPVLLFVDANGAWAGDTECVNGPRGQAETYLTADVVHFAVDTLHVSADPAKWGIVGFSEGGTCAEDLALGHPGLFRHFVDLGGDAAPNVVGSTLRNLFGGSRPALRQHEPSWLLGHRAASYRLSTAVFGAGSKDRRQLPIMARAATAARRAGLPTAWVEGPGGHDWQFCTWALQHVLPTLEAQIGPVPVGHRPGTIRPGRARHRRAAPREVATHHTAAPT